MENNKGDRTKDIKKKKKVSSKVTISNPKNTIPMHVHHIAAHKGKKKKKWAIQIVYLKKNICIGLRGDTNQK